MEYKRPLDEAPYLKLNEREEEPTGHSSIELDEVDIVLAGLEMQAEDTHREIMEDGNADLDNPDVNDFADAKVLGHKLRPYKLPIDAAVTQEDRDGSSFVTDKKLAKFAAEEPTKKL